MSDLRQALARLQAPTDEAAYSVTEFDKGAAFLAGRASNGEVCLLVRTQGGTRTTPLRLSGIETALNVACITVGDSGEAQETLSIVRCRSTDQHAETHFAFALEGVVAELGETPTTDDLIRAMSSVSSLFQELRRPASGSLTGLVGELCCILFAADSSEAVRAWRIATQERSDFVVGRVRLDSKATGGARRIHSVSFDQCVSPAGVLGYFASLVVTEAAGGVTLAALIQMIEERLGGCIDLVNRTRRVVASTLGNSLGQALDWAFDLQAARAGLRYYAAQDVPAIRGALPGGVSSVRFLSDFDQALPLSSYSLRQQLSPAEIGLFAA